MAVSRASRKAGWYYFNVIEPKRLRLVQEAGFIFTPWEGLADVDMLEQEVQEELENSEQSEEKSIASVLEGQRKCCGDNKCSGREE